MNDLFLSKFRYTPTKTAESVEKRAFLRLPMNPDEWEPKIIQHIHQTVPEMGEETINIAFPHMDEQSGTAVGSARVGDKVVVPLVVNKRQLAPLDIFYLDDKEKKPRPMTRNNVTSALQGLGVGKAVTPGFGEVADQSIFAQTQPPFDGRYAFAEAVDFSFDELQKAVDTAITKQAELDYVLETNGAFSDVLQRFAVAGDNRAKTVKVAAAPAPKSEVKFAEVRPFHPVTKAGVYEVRTGNQVVPALVFDVVSDFSGTVKEGERLVDTGRGAVYTSNIIGGRTTDALPKLAAVSNLSGRGYFYTTIGDKAVATEPVRLKSASLSDGFRRYTGVTDVGERVQLVLSPAHKVITKAAGLTMVPNTWRFRQLGQSIKLASVDSANFAEVSSPTVTIRKSGMMYTVDGLGAQVTDTWKKVAETLSGVYTKSGVSAIRQRVDMHKVAHVLAPKSVKTAAVKTASAKLANVRPINLFAEAAFVQPVSFYDPFRLCKVAVDRASVETTIDKMLGLNFLSPTTVSRFVDALPQLEESRDKLAELLLATRLGLDMDQAPIRTAMFAVDGVVSDLHEYRNSMGQTNT